MNDVTISRSALSALVTQSLNPQPLPPREPIGPVPDPWTWATVGQQVIAGIIIVGGLEGQDRGLSAAQLRAIIDDWCGTPPRPPKLPIVGPNGPGSKRSLSRGGRSVTRLPMNGVN
jgi:hypothetical protein